MKIDFNEILKGVGDELKTIEKIAIEPPFTPSSIPFAPSSMPYIPPAPPTPATPRQAGQDPSNPYNVEQFRPTRDLGAIPPFSPTIVPSNVTSTNGGYYDHTPPSKPNIPDRPTYYGAPPTSTGAAAPKPSPTGITPTQPPSPGGNSATEGGSNLNPLNWKKNIEKWIQENAAKGVSNHPLMGVATKLMDQAKAVGGNIQNILNGDFGKFFQGPGGTIIPLAALAGLFYMLNRGNNSGGGRAQNININLGGGAPSIFRGSGVDNFSKYGSFGLSSLIKEAHLLKVSRGPYSKPSYEMANMVPEDLETIGNKINKSTTNLGFQDFDTTLGNTPKADSSLAIHLPSGGISNDIVSPPVNLAPVDVDERADSSMLGNFLGGMNLGQEAADYGADKKKIFDQVENSTRGLTEGFTLPNKDELSITPDDLADRLRDGGITSRFKDDVSIPAGSKIQDIVEAAIEKLHPKLPIPKENDYDFSEAKRYFNDLSRPNSSPFSMTSGGSLPGGAPAQASPVNTGPGFLDMLKNNAAPLGIGAAAAGLIAYLMHQNNKKKQQAGQPEQNLPSWAGVPKQANLIVNSLADAAKRRVANKMLDEVSSTKDPEEIKRESNSKEVEIISKYPEMKKLLKDEKNKEYLESLLKD